MNRGIFTEKWKGKKEKIKQVWNKLKDDEFSEVEGMDHELFGKLKRHDSYFKEKTEKAIKDFKSKYLE
jgi:uncharacterized protein YjbJ (UPF0337 family)